MFGDAYIQSRAQVGTALFSLVRLAQEFDAPAETIAELQQLQEGLREPLLFVVLGEARCGKSSLLNALFQRTFTDAPAETRAVTIYRHGPEAEQQLAGGIVERVRPHMFLRNFTLVDTPPIDLRAEVGQPLAALLARADLIVLMLSSTAVEAERTWRLAGRLDPEQLKRTIFVVDDPETGQFESTVKRVRQVMQKRFTVALPIFACSSRLFLGSTDADEATARRSSGLHEIDRHIDRDIAGGMARLAPVNLARDRAREILGQLSSTAREMMQNVGRDVKLMTDLHGIIEDRKDQSLRQMGGFLWTLTQTLEKGQKRGEETLLDHLSVARLFQMGGDWRRALEDQVDARLRETVRQQIDESLTAVEADQRAVWMQLEEARRKTFPEEEVVSPDFTTNLDWLRSKLNAALVESAIDVPFERRMQHLLLLAAIAMRVAVFTIAGALLLFVFAVLAAPAFVTKAAAAAFAVLVLSCVALLLWQSRLVGEFRRHATARREQFVGAVEDNMRAGIDHFAEDLVDSLGPLQVACAARRRTHEPMLQRAAQLDELLGRWQPQASSLL